MSYSPTAPSGDGTASWGVTGAASAWQAVASNDGDTSYVSVAAASDPCDFTFGNVTVATGYMVMAARLVVTARVTSGAAKLRLTASAPFPDTGFMRHNLPRGSAFTLTSTFTDYAITLCNKPFTHLLSRDNAWDGTELADYEFGFATDSFSGAGAVRVTRFRLELVLREETTLDELLVSDAADIFQWVEVEGIPYILTDRTSLGSTWDVGAYYYGPEYRVVPGVLSTNRAFRSGSINYKSGREEFESAKVTLLDVTETAHEGDADDGTPILVQKAQGFFSWLLAYGDRTNINYDYLADSSAYNDGDGLDPQTGTDGRRFITARNPAVAGFARAGEEDSYIYLDREAIWYGAMNTDGFGDENDVDDLLRARFGSMERVHDPNVFSGVYPIVSDHPTSWNGRWVRWWINAFDKETGLPFPLSLAQARTYLWGTHSQVVGPDSTKFAVRLSAFEGVLKGKLPATSVANVKGLNINNFVMTIGMDDAGAYKTARIEFRGTDEYYARLEDMYQDSAADKLLDQIDSAFTALGVGHTSMAFSQDADGYMHISVGGVTKVKIGFNEEAAAVFGFPGGEWIEPVPNPGDSFSDPVVETQNWHGTMPPASALVSDWAKVIYVEDDHTDGLKIAYQQTAFFWV